jgi:hypothetical protein
VSLHEIVILYSVMGKFQALYRQQNTGHRQKTRPGGTPAMYTQVSMHIKLK